MTLRWVRATAMTCAWCIVPNIRLNYSLNGTGIRTSIDVSLVMQVTIHVRDTLGT